VGLLESSYLAFNYPDLDLYHPWNLSVENATQLALEAENQGLSYHRLITNSEGVEISSHQHHYLYANSLGFSGQYSMTSQSMSCSLLASKNGQMQRDSDYTVSRDAKDLLSFNEVAQNAAKQAIQSLDARTIPTCKVPVLYSPKMAKSLLSNFLRAIQGSNLYRRTSFLVDHLGKKIFPEFVQISQTPHLQKGLGSAPFDTEGGRTKDCFFVKSGVLEHFLLSAYSARRLDMQPNGTSGGPFNLMVKTWGKRSKSFAQENE
jgi:PmbA protein